MGYSNGPCLTFVVRHYCQPPRETSAFSRDFTINSSPQCRAFSRALKTEKLKAPLFPGPYGAGLQMTDA